MALMFPEELPLEVVDNPLLKAERKVYQALKDQLSDDFHAFHSVSYLSIEESGKESDGECDFIIAHPVGGLLFLEVKGGEIRLDENDQWYSLSGVGVEYKIKNPIKQAKRNKFYILEKLRQHRGWGNRFVRIAHCAVLPGVKKTKRDLRFDVPIDILSFAEDMNHIGDFVKRLMRLDRGEEPEESSALGADGLRIFEDMINRRVNLKFSLCSRLEDDHEMILRKSKEQVYLLDELSENARMAIAGAAGTGKTVLALEKVHSLLEQDFQTLFLCYNNPLGVELRSVLGKKENLTVSNFHGFCRDIAIYAEVEADNPEKNAENLFENHESANHEKYDAIVIDEGQDFKDEWLVVLQMLLKDYDNGIYYIFYDDNQNVRHSSREFIRSLPYAKRRLSQNFRNTKHIFSVAEPFYMGNPVRPTGPQGVVVEFKEYPISVGPWVTANSVVRNLVDSEGIKVENIVVLVRSRSEIQAYLKSKTGGARLGGKGITSAAERLNNSIVLDSVSRYKGLESAAIVLICSEGMEKDAELLYTGMTRARTLLHIILPKGKKQFILKPQS